MKKHIWLFPDNFINGIAELSTRKFDRIKCVWHEVNSSGGITLRSTNASGVFSHYTEANMQIVKKASPEVYTNVSCGNPGWMNLLCATKTKRKIAIDSLKTFCKTNKIQGVELDFEGFSKWTPAQYTNFKTFCNELGASLHALNMKLIVDCPPIWNTSKNAILGLPEWNYVISQNYYLFKYEDFNTVLVDELCIMAYDFQFDYGAGVSMQPLLWMQDIINFAKSKSTREICIGIPSAGYTGTLGKYDIKGLTYSQFPQPETATRSLESSELKKEVNGKVYFVSDDVAINMKTQMAGSMGINSVSLWHLGGNKYGN